jgi:hypothetical protein
MAARATTPPARTKAIQDLTRFYTPAEVELHNAPTDLWLSWLGNVYDLTVLAEEKKGNSKISTNSSFRTPLKKLYRRPTSCPYIQKCGKGYITLVR